MKLVLIPALGGPIPVKQRGRSLSQTPMQIVSCTHRAQGLWAHHTTFIRYQLIHQRGKGKVRTLPFKRFMHITS